MEVFNSSGDFCHSRRGFYYSLRVMLLLPIIFLSCFCVPYFRTYAAVYSGGDSVVDDESGAFFQMEIQEDDTEILQEPEAYTVSSGDYSLSVSSVSSDVVYDNLEEFESSPVYVDRYEYEILKRLEFIQYAAAIIIALLFLLIFRRK